ncbi:K+/H+ antiporter subunit F [Propionivibrio sp.]|jgi:multicomponent K+:H+ antiporter subunit F|uniref:K+/H+ antiporter subunit F n=1 Tax=Propionivibrio sp. TaxID=2212460 RepID=UPI0025E8A6E9|nr:K+/H+ antiporter subunit F [Propionivibrio sp.]
MVKYDQPVVSFAIFAPSRLCGEVFRMNALLTWAVQFALVCFALAMLLAFLRLLRGPAAEDRILALDTLYVCSMLTMLALGIGFGSSTYFGIALVIALFGFVGSAALAKFLLRGEVIEP